MRLIYLMLLALCASFTSFSQDSSYTISAPIDVPRLGWFKVMLMDNGNTLLFHLQPRKGIVVKTFDKDRKEISNLKHLCGVIDINALDRSELKGIYQINHEAVMFVTQYIDNRETLVRLRFSADNGKLIKEEKVIQSPSFQNKTSCYVIKNDAKDDYSVFCFKNLELFPKEPLKLIKYNAEHKEVKDITLPNLGLDTIHYAKMVSADADKNGSICITLQLSKIQYYPDVLDKYLITCYLPAGADQFVLLKTKLELGMEAYHSSYRFNPFSNSLNLIHTTVQLALLKDGLRPVTEAVYTPYMFIYDQADLNSKIAKLVENKRADNYRKQLTGTTRSFQPVPLKVFTNENGLTTIFSEEITTNALLKGIASKNTYVGHIGITQLNEKGEEIWGTVLPVSQYVPCQLSPYDYSFRGIIKPLFHEEHDRTYQSQFSSFNCFTSNKCYYIIYNDLKANADKKISDNMDTVFSFNTANAFYYKMGKKRDMAKAYLFGNPADNESKSVMTESADYNEATGTYAALVLYRKDDKYSTHIAWCHLN